MNSSTKRYSSLCRWVCIFLHQFSANYFSYPCNENPKWWSSWHFHLFATTEQHFKIAKRKYLILISLLFICASCCVFFFNIKFSKRATNQPTNKPSKRATNPSRQHQLDGLTWFGSAWLHLVASQMLHRMSVYMLWVCDSVLRVHLYRNCVLHARSSGSRFDFLVKVSLSLFSCVVFPFRVCLLAIIVVLVAAFDFFKCISVYNLNWINNDGFLIRVCVWLNEWVSVYIFVQ